MISNQILAVVVMTKIKQISDEMIILVNQHRQENYPNIPEDLIKEIIISEDSLLTEKDSGRSLSKTREIIDTYFEEVR